MGNLVTQHFSTGVSEKAIASMSPQKLGEFGEELAMQIFAARGYGVFPAWSPNVVSHGDINVYGASIQSPLWSIEVKTARPHYYNGKPRWNFGLYKIGKTDHKKAHLTMLQAIDGTLAYIFLFPSSLLDAHIFTLTSHPLDYRGRMYPFLMPENFTITYMQSVVTFWLA